MYVLYDDEGILRFINSDKDACIDYAKLFEQASSNFCLIDLNETQIKRGITNPVLNPVENNS